MARARLSGAFMRGFYRLGPLDAVAAPGGQVRDVSPGFDGPAAVRVQQAVDARVVERIGTLGIRGGAVHVAVHYAEHAAVCYDRGEILPRRPDALERRPDALAKLGTALAAGRRVARVTRAELQVSLGLLALELGVGPALELAVAALAQRSVVHDVEFQRGGDRRRGRAGATGVAAVDCGDTFACEPAREPPRLRLTVLGQAAVGVVALDAAFAVPLSLAVPDQEEPDLSHAS